MLEIRQESKNDYKEVYNVVKKAFETAEHSDGNEQDLVVELRSSNNFIPELSLVAIKDKKIVGHIMFTKIMIGKTVEIALAPLAILPEYQKQGIGTKLISEGHRIAKEMGYHYCVVIGSEKFYPKIGYIPAENFEIIAPFQIDSKNFMAIKLNDTKEQANGVVKYAKEFKI